MADEAGDMEMPLAGILVTHGLCRAHVPLYRSDEAEMAAAAAVVQDMVIDEVWDAWPACPGHHHPMEPDVISGVAVWRCPGGQEPSLPIGGLSV